MLTYLPLLLVQPWKALSRRQRRFVWRQCVHPLTTRWPLMLAKSVLLFCALMAVVLPGKFHGWQEYLAIFVVMLFTTDVFDMILVARFRQRIVSYIQEHGPEIQSVA